jgi:hypothetical protein
VQADAQEAGEQPGVLPTMRRSVERARLMPAPTAAPRTAAMVGTCSVPTRRKAV